MQRIELIKRFLKGVVEKCDSKELYKLLFDFQHVDVMHGYAIATLQSFEDIKIGMCNDQEVLDIMRNGEYDRMFEEWLLEEV